MTAGTIAMVDTVPGSVLSLHFLPTFNHPPHSTTTTTVITCIENPTAEQGTALVVPDCNKWQREKGGIGRRAMQRCVPSFLRGPQRPPGTALSSHTAVLVTPVLTASPYFFK